jgi:hypothetical protein
MLNVIDYETLYDDAGDIYIVETVEYKGHYILYVNKEFYASMDNAFEVNEEIQDIIDYYRLTYIKPI